MLLFWVISFSWLTVKGQSLSFDKINEELGLPQSSVQSIVNDHYGYLWVATDAGVSRYDGNHFETVQTKLGSLVQQNWQDKVVQMTANGNFLWVLQTNGLSRIDVRSLEVNSMSFKGLGSYFAPTSIAVSGKKVLLGSKEGFTLLSTDSFKLIKHFNTDPVIAISQVKHGIWLVTCTNGFYVFYPFQNRLFKLDYSPESFIRVFCMGNGNQFYWLEGEGRLMKGVYERGKLSSLNEEILLDNYAASCMGYYQNKLYLGTEKGLLELAEKGAQRWYVTDGLNPLAISHNVITSIYPDKQGKLWVGTRNGGLNVCNPFLHKFKKASPELLPDYKDVKEVLALAGDESGEIAFTTGGGDLGWFDPKDESIFFIQKTGLTINALCHHQKGIMLAGTPGGLYLADKNGLKPVFLGGSPENQAISLDIKSIIKAKDGKYWLAGEGGLSLYDLKKRAVESHFHVGNTNLPTNHIRAVAEAPNGLLYLGTVNGLFSFDPISGKAKLITIKTSGQAQPFVGFVLLDGNRVIAGSKEGLFVIETNGKVVQLSKENGLPDNHIYAIVKEKSGNAYWASCNKGLFRISDNLNQVTLYDISDGLQGSEFIEGAVYQSPEGSLYFGGLSGFNYFLPNRLIADTMSFKTVINGLSVFNNKIPFQEYYNIPLEQNFITIEFAALDFNLNGGNVFYYQLEGLQEDWIVAGNRRFASFGKLEPGDYIFRVKARNMDGKVSANEAQLYFTIVPPFYQKVGFKIGALLLLAISIFFLVNWRLKTRLKKAQEKAAINAMIGELELKALRAQMNPHFIFNSLNSIQDFVLNHESRLAAKYLSKFAKLIRMILDLSEQTFVTLEQKITFLNLYVELELLRLNQSFSWDVEIDPELSKEVLVPTLLIQPHIENAIWHGLQHKQHGDKRLKLSLRRISENQIEAIIEDNGIGRKAAMEIGKNRLKMHHSKGSKLTEERVRVLEQLIGAKPKVEIIDLYDENNLACGTKVVLIIPVKYEY